MCTPVVLFATADISPLGWVVLTAVSVVLAAILLCELLGMRYIPNNRVGIIEKLWSPKGSVSEGTHHRGVERRGRHSRPSLLRAGGVHRSGCGAGSIASNTAVNLVYGAAGHDRLRLRS